MPPKHIGMVSVTGPGSALTFQCLAELCVIKKAYPTITLNHLPWSEYSQALLQQDWDWVARIALTSLSILQKAGADFAIMPANTAHFAIEQIAIKTPISFLSMLDCVTESIHRSKYQNIAVLGTQLTMQKKLYRNAFAQYELPEVSLDTPLIEAINGLIYNELIPGKINQNTVKNIARQLQQIDCDCFALACTELSVVFNDKILLKPCVDTTRVLAESAFNHALS